HRAPKRVSMGKEGLASSWTLLAGEDPAKAHEALWALVAAPEESVAFLKARLKPVDGGKIQKLLTDLNSAQFAARQAALKELTAGAEQALGAMRMAINQNLPLETQRRLQQIIKDLPDIPGPDTVRTIRAIMVLERIGSTEARSVLETLARGASGA